MSSGHSTLSPALWAALTRDQRLMMIANEMNRASKLMAPEDRERLKSACARVLLLTDLTVDVRPERGLRKELPRCRDRIAQLWLQPEDDPAAHRETFRSLLLMSCETAKQIPFVLGEGPAAPR